YDDGNSNTVMQNQNVIITDTTNPVPDVTNLSDVTAECTVTALTAPTATDNCAGVITATHNASLPITTQGTTVVVWTYDDGNGNTVTQNQNVVINDTTAPVPDVSSLSDVTASLVVNSLTPPSATDNCGGLVTVTNNATLPITGQGTTVVIWTYDDGNGNTSTQNQNVVLNDANAPVPDLANLPDVTAECLVNNLTAPTATDNSGPITGTTTTILPIITQGTTVVVWTYDDGNGNTVTQNQNVVINDTTAPVPDSTNLVDVTAECSVASLTAPTATDICGGTVTVTNNATLPITAQGITVVVWSYDDGNGNTTIQNQNVVINDTTAPVPDSTTLVDVTAECSVVSLTAPTATDNCSGAVTVTNNATLPITAQGTTVVVWSYDDGNGNTTIQNQNVVINDTTAPVPDSTTLADVTAECSVASLNAPTATDNCSGAVTITNNATLPITAQGTTVVIWSYDDGNGNSVTQNQNVVINDTTAPVPDSTTLADITAECSVVSLTAPTATDNCGGTITVTNNATLPITAQGTTVVVWTYDDGNGNTTIQNQNVVINDTTAPVPDSTALADVTAECSVASLTAPTATDNCGGTITVTNNATLPITAQGTTVVVWTYDDGNGNTTTQNQNVVINDTTAPVPDSTTLADVTAECSVASLTAPTATDNCSGAVTVTNNATLPITAQGTTVVIWTYDDGNGNTMTQNQNVVINDTTAPVPDSTTLADVTAECSVAILTAPTASDNCSGTVTAMHNATLPITLQDTTVVTWTYDDGNGNTVTQDQRVVILPLPFSLSANTPVCLEGTLEPLIDTLLPGTYNWTGPNGFIDSVPLPAHPITEAADSGWYFLSLTTPDGCMGIDSVFVNVITGGIALNTNFLVASTACVGDTIHFLNVTDLQGQAVNYSWDFGNGLISDLEDPTLTYTNPGIQNISVEITVGNCINESVTKTIDIISCKRRSNIEGQQLKYVETWPNPTMGAFTLEIDSHTEDPILLIVSRMNGEVVETRQLKGSLEYREQFNYETMGLYLIKLITNQGSVSKKVLVVN
ncbi:MAG: T9SS type A sorting domain-containing protein, partial [Salibacteraceae bacterium]